MKILTTCLALFLLCSQCSLQAEEVSPTEGLFRSTFKIVGPKAGGGTNFGTVFLVTKPNPDSPQAPVYVLVTAAHVLDGIEGESATLMLRVKQGETYRKRPYTIMIRDGSRALWASHPEVDLAAMIVSLPTEADRINWPADKAATDEVLIEEELGVGEEVLALGYPYSKESNEAGFPVLRSGRIASFPITPTAITKTFYVDLEVFAGNSGGPVFFPGGARRTAFGAIAGSPWYLLGVASKEGAYEEEIKSLTKTETVKHKLKLMKVVHASFVAELIESVVNPER